MKLWRRRIKKIAEADDTMDSIFNKKTSLEDEKNFVSYEESSGNNSSSEDENSSDEKGNSSKKLDSDTQENQTYESSSGNNSVSTEEISSNNSSSEEENSSDDNDKSSKELDSDTQGEQLSESLSGNNSVSTEDISGNNSSSEEENSSDDNDKSSKELDSDTQGNQTYESLNGSDSVSTEEISSNNSSSEEENSSDEKENSSKELDSDTQGEQLSESLSGNNSVSTEEISGNNSSSEEENSSDDNSKSSKELGSDTQENQTYESLNGSDSVSTEDISGNNSSSEEENSSDEKGNSSKELDSDTQGEHLSESLSENGINFLEDKRKEKLQMLYDRLVEYKNRKQQIEDSQIKDTNNSYLLEQLSELKPYFEREHNDGFSVSLTDDFIPDSLIRTLINKFLNQRFCSSADLNVRSTALMRADGFYRWDLNQIIRHLETEQVTKIPYDKYGYRYAEGKHENIPLSFYFDMSGSMDKYSNMLANIALELLKKDVKVLVGFNATVMYQFDFVDKDIDISLFANIIKEAGNGSRFIYDDKKIKLLEINDYLDRYLISKKAEKCVVFADFDPLNNVNCLSETVDVYWFCFEEDIRRRDTSSFKGFLYQVCNEASIARGLVEVSEYRFNTLCKLQESFYQKKK